MIKFKVHVQKSLEDYEGFVAEEVEKEWEGLEEGEEGETKEEPVEQDTEAGAENDYNMHDDDV